jgi:hypothetical protein
MIQSFLLHTNCTIKYLLLQSCSARKSAQAMLAVGHRPRCLPSADTKAKAGKEKILQHMFHLTVHLDAPSLRAAVALLLSFQKRNLHVREFKVKPFASSESTRKGK